MKEFTYNSNCFELIVAILVLLTACSNVNNVFSPTSIRAGTEAPNTSLTGTTSTHLPATPTAHPTNTIAPTVEPSPTLIPKLSQPTIINTYMVSSLPGGKGSGPGAMLVLSGQIWTATMFAGLQQWDPATGTAVKTLADIQASQYWDIKFDGRYLWVLASEQTESSADSLYMIDPNRSELVKRFDIGKSGDFGLEPTQLGISPGRIWVNDGVISTDTLEYTHLPNGLPSDAHFAYDNHGWIWITGSWCHGCNHDLWIVNTDDPQQLKDEQHSGILGEGTLDKPLILAGGKIWLIAVSHDQASSPIYFLEGYDPLHTDIPVFREDISAEVPLNSQIHLAADGKVLWVEAEGTLYYYSLEDASLLGSLQVGADVQGIGFDGRDLWILSLKEGLQQISLPW